MSNEDTVEEAARKAGARARAASEKRHKLALELEAANQEAEAAHKALVDLVGVARAGHYIHLAAV